MGLGRGYGGSVIKDCWLGGTWRKKSHWLDGELFMEGGHSGPEFLKGATVWPYGRTQFFTDCARFLFYLFKVIKKKCIYGFWPILFTQNLQTEKLDAQFSLLLESFSGP